MKYLCCWWQQASLWECWTAEKETRCEETSGWHLGWSEQQGTYICCTQSKPPLDDWNLSKTEKTVGSHAWCRARAIYKIHAAWCGRRRKCSFPSPEWEIGYCIQTHQQSSWHSTIKNVKSAGLWKLPHLHKVCFKTVGRPIMVRDADCFHHFLAWYFFLHGLLVMPSCQSWQGKFILFVACLVLSFLVP